MGQANCGRGGLSACTAAGAACALGYFALQRLLNLAGREVLSLWKNGAGAGALSADYAIWSWALTLCIGALSLGLPVWAAVCLRGVHIAHRLHRAPRGMLAPALLFYLGASELLNLLAAKVGESTGSVQAISLPQGGAALLLAFLAVCVVPPVGEELLFRGAVQSCLRPCGAWLAVIGQAVLFAVLHGKLSAVVFALPAGLFFGYLAEATDSLLPGMCLHFVNNTMAFGLLWLNAHGLQSAADVLQSWLLLFCPLAAAAVLVWIVRGKKRVFPALPRGRTPLRLLQSPAWMCVTAFFVLAAWKNW